MSDTSPPPLDPKRHALLLDFDGTLVEFADDPRAVRLRPAVLHRLVTLQPDLGGALAMVSGRAISQLDHFLDPLRFVAAGVHGLEQRLDAADAVVNLAGPESMDPLRHALAVPLGLQPNLLLEDKGSALVLHYREFPELEPVAKAMMEQAVGGMAGFDVLYGNRVVEVHRAGMNKGVAVSAILGRAPFAGRVPVYLGDDATDEFAFAAVQAVGGETIKVGPGPTRAAHRLASVSAVHRWLGVWDDAR